MKVLEHSESRLVIKDGSPWYKLFLIRNLFGGKWNTAIEICSGIGLIALVTAWKLGKIPDELLIAARFIFFVLAAPFLLAYVSRPRGRPSYVFDRSTGLLTVYYHDESSRTYALTDIMDVVAATTENDHPPSTVWRKVCLMLRSGETLELHPGHEEPKKQQEMVALIRRFLNLHESK